MKQGTMGWLLLIVILAIPAFLFYRWRSGMQAAQSSAISTIARSRIPVADVFGKSPPQPRFSPPASQAAPVPAVASRMSPPSGASAAPAVFRSSVSAAPTPIASAPIAPAAAAAPALASQAASADNADNDDTVARDPTLSPADYADLARARALESERRWRLLHPIIPKKRKVYKPPIESTVRLIGIIYVPGNPMAIVNDATVGEGGRIGDVRVLRITRSSVVFAYKNKRFVKTISK